MNPIEIRSQQQLDELKQKHGEAFFTMRSESIEVIVELTDDQIDELFLLFQKLLFIFAIENSTTIKNPSDEILLQFFINMEMAKLFDSPSKRHRTATLRNFINIKELEETLDKHKDSIDRLTTYRQKELAHTDLDAPSYSDPIPILEYTGLLKEITDILFKVFYVYSKQNQQRLGEHNLLEELLRRNDMLKSFYSDEKMLGKKIMFQVEGADE